MQSVYSLVGDEVDVSKEKNNFNLQPCQIRLPFKLKYLKFERLITTY